MGISSGAGSGSSSLPLSPPLFYRVEQKRNRGRKKRGVQETRQSLLTGYFEMGNGMPKRIISMGLDQDSATGTTQTSHHHSLPFHRLFSLFLTFSFLQSTYFSFSFFLIDTYVQKKKYIYIYQIRMKYFFNDQRFKKKKFNSLKREIRKGKILLL